MNPILKKILIAILIIALVIALIFIVAKTTKKNSSKKEETKIEEKQPEKQEVSDDDIVLPQEDVAKTIKCTYKGEEENVIWEESYVNFSIDENNKVITREDVREYQFERVNIDDYINNKTLAVISSVLDGINGINSSLESINAKEHIYRFSTTFDFKTLNLDDLYNFYYKKFYNNGDLKMSREDFDKRYKCICYMYYTKNIHNF